MLFLAAQSLRPYQCFVAGDEQSSGPELLSDLSFLAEGAVTPHHHHRFAADHIRTDARLVAQQSGGQVHQGKPQLEERRHNTPVTMAGTALTPGSSLFKCV